MRVFKAVCALLVGIGTLSAVLADETVSGITGKGKAGVFKVESLRNSDKYILKTIPEGLSGLPAVSVPRGSYSAPGSGYSFTIAKPATVYILVDQRDRGQKLEGWEKTELTAEWMADRIYKDWVYKKDFEAGTVEIPANSKACLPNLAIIETK